MMALPSPRISVFVSSTIGECAAERMAARKAIEGINCEPVLFERTGARPHPARITYLQGLSRSQICIILWKESYGFIDPAIGISGIEDEFRIAREKQLDILIYIKADAPNRDPRLTSLIENARGLVTTHSYQTEADLSDQISSDITSLLSAAYIDRIAPRAERLTDPSAVLAGAMPAGTMAISRPLLEEELTNSVAMKQLTWLIGAAGAGKTILLAQWAHKHGAAYVNARDLSFRHLLLAMAAALSGRTLAPDSITLGDASQILRTAWKEHAKWPLVIDDPTNVQDLTRAIEDFGPANGSARIIIGTRTSLASPDGNVVQVFGLTSAEAAEIIRQLPGAIRDSVTASTSTIRGIFPLAIRREAAAQQSPEYLVFDDVSDIAPDPVVRELLALIVASPEPLTLEDLVELSANSNPILVDGHLSTLSFLIADDGLGFRLVHEELAQELRRSLARRAALERLVSLRLAQFFSRAKRYLAAFTLYQSFDPKRALGVAYRGAVQAAREGRFASSVSPLQFIVRAKEKAGERLDLALALVSLSQTQEITGDLSSARSSLDRAEAIGNEINDPDLHQYIEDQKLIRRVRHQLQPADLEALRRLRQRYREEGRIADSARLAAEEGSILISIGEHEKSTAVLREARAGFSEIGDSYGLYIATRNLIGSLNMIEGGESEAEELLRSLQDDGDSHELRERAWMCNILARRYRLDNRLDDAVSAAKEAIDIGKQLNDPHVVALNRIGLGNALRQKGDLKGALDCFRECGKEAQSIDRKEIDGLASRLAATVLVDLAEESAPYLRPQLYGEAEQFATYVIGLLKGSIAEVQAAEAFDCRGDARFGLGRKVEALADFAEAAKLFLRFDEHRALRILQTISRNLDLNDPTLVMKILLSALPEAAPTSDSSPWVKLLNFIQESITKAHPEAVGIYIRVALKMTHEIIAGPLELGLWLRLLKLALEGKSLQDDGRLAFVLSNFLAHTRKRDLSVVQLTALTDLTLGQSKSIHFHAVGQHLQTSFNMGPENKVLIVLDDIDGTQATRFCSTALSCFFTAFRGDIDRMFLSSPIENGLFIRCSIVDSAKAPADIRAVLQNNTDVPVTVAMFEPKSDQPRELIIACRDDLQSRCHADPMKATDLQFMYTDVLRALLIVVLGGDIESAVLRPKIVSLITRTI